MNVKEAIDLINNSDNCYSLLDVEDLLVECKFIKRQNYNYNERCIIVTDVYEVDDGYVGVGGILKFRSPLKFLDFKVHCIAEEYKASQAIVYTPKN